MAKKLAFTDSFFVKLDLDKSNTKEIKKKWKAQKETQLLKQYPYLTFMEVEKLFEFLGEKGTKIDSVSIARIDEKGKPTTKNEVTVSYFTLDEDYENLLKTFSEALLNDPQYVSLQFEQKIDYLENYIFPAYQKSTDCNEEHIPLLPEVPEEDFMECPVPFYDSSVQYRFIPEKMESEIEEVVPEHTDEKTLEMEQDDQFPDIDENVGDDKQEDVDIHVVQEKHENDEQLVDNHQHLLIKDTNKAVNGPNLLSLTYFDTEPIQKLEAYHPEYVSNELAKLKIDFNKKIKKVDDELQKEQHTIYLAKQKNLDEEKNKILQEWLKEHDNRSQLKPKFVSEGQEELRKLEKDLIISKEKEKQDELDNARLVYEKAVADIHSKFRKDTQSSLSHIREKTSSSIESRYQDEYISQTNQLQKSMNDEELRINEKNNKILKVLSDKVQKIIQEKDCNLQSMYQKELEAQKLQFNQIHNKAVIEKRELDKTEAFLNFKEEVEQVRKQLEGQSHKFQENVSETLEPQISQENTTKNPAKVSKEKGMGMLVMVATPILAVIGTVSYFFFQII